MAEVEQVEPDYSAGQQVDLTIADGAYEGTYSTEVSDVDEKNLIVEIPQINDLYLPLTSGGELVVKHYEEGATLEAETRVINRNDDGDPPVLFIEIPETIKRIQRRDFVRVPCDVSVDVNVLKSGDDDRSFSGTLEGTLEDISAGGVQVILEEKLPLFTEIELVFKLPIVRERLSDVFGQIVRVPDENEGPFSMGVKFTSITEAQRNDIIQYVYEKQMRLQGEDED